MLQRQGLWLAGLLGACASGTASRLDAINDSMVAWGPPEPTSVDTIAGLKALDRSTYVKAVLRRHPSTRAAKEAVLAAIARVSQSGTLPSPMVTFGLAPLSIGSEQVPFGASVELRQRLPNLPQLSLLEESATLRAEMQRDEAE